jgi:hypothetical protein
VSELKKRTFRIQQLEAQIIAAKRTPDDLAALIMKIEAGARAKLADLRNALADRRDLREVFLALFPDGLKFTPGRAGDRSVWRIEGAASFGSLVGGDVPLPIALRPRRGVSQSGPRSGISNC